MSDSSIVIQKKSTKTYKCPYCEYRGDRLKLISHIEKTHSDLIPQNYSPTRVVFNLINKKENGSCVICKTITTWDENKCRYNRMCDKESCKIEYKKRTENNILKVYGKTSREMLNDMDHQTKMLNGRSISGVYKWSNGLEKSYTGTFELKCLIFFDTIIKARYEDVVTPGPVVEYMFEDKKHQWITDIFYAPYNLVIECKDGGSNPNNRPMESYRAKQIAKEKAITRDGNYNYLRLTNNSFEQLLHILSVLKLQLIDTSYDNKKVVMVNENMMSTIGAMFPMANNADNVYIVNRMMNNSFIKSDIGVSDDIRMNNVIYQDDDGAIKETTREEFLEGYKSVAYSIPNKHNKFKELLESKDLVFAPNKIYETLFDKRMFTTDQLLCENLNPVFDLQSYYKTIEEVTENTIKNSSVNTIITPDFSYGENVDLCTDKDGYFLQNKGNGMRTKYHNDKMFSLMEAIIISGGVL